MKKIIVVAIFAMAMMASNAFSGQFKVEYEIVSGSDTKSGRKVAFASDAEEAADKVAKQLGFVKNYDGSYTKVNYQGPNFELIIIDVTEKEAGNSSQEEEE